MKGGSPANFPFRAGSLTAGSNPKCSDKAASREGVGVIDDRLVASLSGEAKGQAVGRRTATGIVKVIRQALLAESGIPRRRASVLWAKPDSVGEANGNAHPTQRRCKRRRHVWTDSLSQLGRPRTVPTRNGVMTRMGCPRPQATSDRRGIEAVAASTMDVYGISAGIKRNAESRREAVRGVGDGHSSDDGRDNTTRPERRAISLSVLTLERGDPR